MTLMALVNSSTRVWAPRPPAPECGAQSRYSKRKGLLLVAVPAEKAHKHWRRLVDQQAVHGLLYLFFIKGRWGVHLCIVLNCQVGPPPVGALGLHQSGQDQSLCVGCSVSTSLDKVG